MNMEKPESLPKKNTLPLNIEASKKHATGAESTVWKTDVTDVEGAKQMIALKEVRKEAFADEGEMRKSQKFYEFLKNFPGFGKFVPETLYFKAQLTPDSPPQAFCIQKFIKGERIDRIKDDELYKDPEIIKQLLEFIDASVKILQATREDKMHKPDFMWAPEPSGFKIRIEATLSNPRYSSNIFIADKPDKNGQRVFFVDTGTNVAERTSQFRKLHGRYVVNPLHKLQFARWKKRLEKALKDIQTDSK